MSHSHLRMPNPNACKFCGKQFTKDDPMEHHIAFMHEEEELTCPYWHCDYRAKTKVCLRLHIDAKHNKGKYPCHHCEYKANIKLSLKRHIETVHENKRYPCDKCEFKGKSERSVKLHIESIHEKKRYPCTECNRIYTQKMNLNRHKKITHFAETINCDKIKYPCHLCEYKANIKRTLQCHIEAKHENKRYPCDQCDYKATHTGSLKLHKVRKHLKPQLNY